eukprot:1785074-Rhodomonas_salina.1
MQLYLFICIIYTVCLHVASSSGNVCGNGLLEIGEDCDDGNTFNGDGCDGFCHFEDGSGQANGTVWYCRENNVSRTICCPTLNNPVTHSLTCSCDGQVSDYVGYSILSDCTKQDIDECTSNHGGCAPLAACTNLD